MCVHEKHQHGTVCVVISLYCTHMWQGSGWSFIMIKNFGVLTFHALNVMAEDLLSCKCSSANSNLAVQTALPSGSLAWLGMVRDDNGIYRAMCSRDLL